MPYFGATRIHHRLIAGLLPVVLGGCSTIMEPSEEKITQLEDELTTCRAQHGQHLASDRTIAEGMTKLDASIATLTGELKTLSVNQSCSPDEPTASADPGASQGVATKTDQQKKVATDTDEQQKLVVGRREKVWVEDLQLALPARIDTGAETASLDARNITPFERDGKSWVRFDIPDPNGDEELTLERPVERNVLIIQASAEEPERRYVIKLGIQIGSVRQLAEFTLSDRGHLDYQMLVGRNVLQDVMLVDVSGTNLVSLPLAIKPSTDATKDE